jgi:hypothetical protein
MEQQRGYSLVDNTIIIDRELTELDVFVKDFLDIIKEYTDYLVVSGFVNIYTGRTRGTENVDIIFPIFDEKRFIQLFLKRFGEKDFKSKAREYLKGTQ